MGTTGPDAPAPGEDGTPAAGVRDATAPGEPDATASGLDGQARAEGPPVTPDGRYIAVRGRLWRRTDPGLDPERRAALVGELMAARAAVRAALHAPAGDAGAMAAARARVDAAKRGLGERGPVWWTDGAPDLTRHLARTTPYAAWFAALPPAAAGYGAPAPAPALGRLRGRGAGRKVASGGRGDGHGRDG